MVDYNASFKRPFSDWKKLIIGCLFSIVPIVNFFAIGYVLRMISSTLKKDLVKLPEWNKFGNLFVKGLMTFFIAILYFLPAIIIMVVALVPIVIDVVSTAGYNVPEEVVMELINQEMVSLTSFTWLMILAGALMFISSYFLPIAIINYVKKNKFSKAFEISVFKKVFTLKYFLAWILILFLSLIASMLGDVIYVGFILEAFAGFIVYVIGFTLLTQVYTETK